MYESHAQSRIAEKVIKDNPEELTATISDTELTVIIQVGEYDAAYTANEARELVEALLSSYHQRSQGDNTIPIADYIYDLASVVDNEKTIEQVENKWQHEGELGGGQEYSIFSVTDGGPYMSFGSKPEAQKFCEDWNKHPCPIDYYVESQ